MPLNLISCFVIRNRMLFRALITRDDVVSQRLEFGSAFLSSSMGVCFFNFPVSRARATSNQVEVRLDCTSRKKILRQQRREKYSRLCSRSKGARLGLGRLKILSRFPAAGRFAGVGFLFLLSYSQKARMSRIYYLRNRSSLGGFAA